MRAHQFRRKRPPQRPAPLVRMLAFKHRLCNLSKTNDLVAYFYLIKMRGNEGQIYIMMYEKIQRQRQIVIYSRHYRVWRV